ncbi:sugar ABC transporter substrate-binding protein [Galactobacter valiniphilus]|uniref:Sugar ABC transporter substrate-binding protein n=2 Tax=Galactobacter valiniphilus TaxID=2676122 RepID=A0A399JB89_9MICC|nr:sugar ABC transporter substrate-binding protein [Galactobacter valiniphilus]
MALGTAGALALSGCAGGSAAPADGSSAPVKIGFFGFAASNSFAQGTFSGVKKAAEANGATATFVDGNFDGQAQAQQITDAVTSKQFDVMIVQANDNLVVKQPLENAIKAGITVVIEFVPVGDNFDTTEPQIEGAISIVDPPVGNGKGLATMGLDACKQVSGECEVAYMEGNPALPLDNARTKAVLDTLATGSNVKVLPKVTGGYTQDDGRKAYQSIVQANPGVDVIIGSTQAIAGAWEAGGKDTEIKFVGNGASIQAVDHVRNGDWFGIWSIDVLKDGETAAEYGIKKHRGEDVALATAESSLGVNNGLGTKEALDKANFVSGYNE